MLFWWAAGWHSQVHTAQFSFFFAQFETVPCYLLTGTPRSLTGLSPASGATGSYKAHSILQLQKKIKNTRKKGWPFAPRLETLFRIPLL